MNFIRHPFDFHGDMRRNGSAGGGGASAASSPRNRNGRAEERRRRRRRALAAARRRRRNETNVRRLSLYLCGGRKYEHGVRYVGKMTKHHGNGDEAGFLKYAARYLRTVRDDEVARFRAARMIEKCYGAFAVRLLHKAMAADA